MNNYLKVDKLSFSYEADQKILCNVSFTVGKGELLGILGPNGGGKTTLLRILAGLINYTDGEILVNSINYKDKMPTIGIINQKDQFNSLGAINIIDFLSSSRKLIKVNKIIQALDYVGFKKCHNSLMRDLSGGELQRIFIARSYLSKKDLYLFDEPTKGLDSTGEDELIKIIKKMTSEQNKTIIMIDHNINTVLKHCDKILCLNKKFHWHEKSDLVSKDILNNTYNCEFEHILIHEDSKHSCKDHEE